MPVLDARILLLMILHTLVTDKGKQAGMNLEASSMMARVPSSSALCRLLGDKMNSIAQL